MGIFTWFNKEKLTDIVYSEKDNSIINNNQSFSINPINLIDENTDNDLIKDIAKKSNDEIIQDNNDFDVEKLGVYDPTLELSNYAFPSLSLLREQELPNLESQEISTEKIIRLLNSFGIKIKSVNVNIGAVITLYEIVLEEGIRIATLRKYQEDISIGLAVSSILISPIPERGSVGIIIPNKNPQILLMSSILDTNEFKITDSELPVIIGKTLINDPLIVDLTQISHLLVAGATGQGKSVALNTMIISLLYKKHPSELKFVLIDPRIIEFNVYSIIKNHFLAKLYDAKKPVISGIMETFNTLNALIREMDDRYILLEKSDTRNIREYNEKFINRKLNPYKGFRYMPYIVVVIDEFGDFIISGDNNFGLLLTTLTSRAHIVGIHLIISTQRPTNKVISETIKANIPARLAFKVASSMESRIIMEESGAEQLVGCGDSLFSFNGNTIRIQAPFVNTEKVANVVKFIASQQGYPSPYFLPDYLLFNEEPKEIDLTNLDPLFNEAARLIVNHQQGSTSLIQRKFSIGYNRAGRLMDQLEAAGIVGQIQGNTPRDVLISNEYQLEKILSSLL